MDIIDVLIWVCIVLLLAFIAGQIWGHAERKKTKKSGPGSLKGR